MTTTPNSTAAPVTRRATTHAATPTDWRRRPEPLTTTWEHRSACFNRPQEWWDGDDATLTERARAMCRSCPVLDQCLRERMQDEGQTAWHRYGVRGGLTGAQRIQLFVDEWTDGPYDAEEARLIALEAVDEGRSAAEVAASDVGETTVRLAARLAGEMVAPRTPPSLDERRGGSAVERAFAQADEILRMRQDGVGVKDIGKRLGIGRTALDEVLRAYREFAKPMPEAAGEDDLDGWLRGANVRLTNDQKLEAICRAVRAGKSFQQIDRDRGVGITTTMKFVGRRRKAYEESGQVFPAVLQNRTKFTAEQVRQMREMYAAGGVTDQDIALRFDAPRNSISHVLSGRNYKKAGGPIREGRSLASKRASRKFCGHTDLDAPVAQAS